MRTLTVMQFLLETGLLWEAANYYVMIPNTIDGLEELADGYWSYPIGEEDEISQPEITVKVVDLLGDERYYELYES